MFQKLIIPLILTLIACMSAITPATAQETLRAAFLYVGPIGDYGWSYAHDSARLKAEEALPWLETVYVESVSDADLESVIDQVIRQGAEVVFTTSFSHMEGTYRAAERHPEIIFANATGFMRAPNLATFMAELMEPYYVNGLAAGALTQTGIIGYVAAFPIPEQHRHIAALAIGAREVNPEAEIRVRWLFSWYDPSAAKEAAESLIAEGADVLAYTEDSPTVAQTAAEHGLPSFSHSSPMLHFAPETIVSGQLKHWEAFYIPFLEGVKDGTYTSTNLEYVDVWLRLADGGAEVGADWDMPVNPLWIDRLGDTYDLMLERIEQMKNGEFHPFTGPLYDRQGNLVVAEGETASYSDLMTMSWAAEGIVGSWPAEE